MLVLSRKVSQQIVIGDLVTVTIVAIQGDKIRLGIQAPKEVSVHRKEVYELIKLEEEKALARKAKEDAR